MEKIELEITELLETKLAIHFFAPIVREKISATVADLNKPTLVIINSRNTDIFDYGFAQIAFQDILGDNENENLFVAFFIDGYDKDEFFSGIVHLRNFDNFDKLSDEELVKKNGINLILVNNQNEISYITNLSDEHKQVLKEIENHEKVTSDHLQKKFSLMAEKITKILDELLKSKFIYSSEEAPDTRFYFSVKRLII
jgi:hypothetical protein